MNEFENLKIHPENIIVPGRVYYKESTDSTNLDAKREENVPDKSIFIAETQTSGKGRMGRTWSSPKGCGIWMSIYLKPNKDIEYISQITLIAGLAVSKVIENSTIKWPNDILIGDKKVAGILTEMSVKDGKINNIVVGVGINVNNVDFPDEIKDRATSLYIESGKIWQREKLVSDIVHVFLEMYDKFVSDGFSAFREEYTKKCITLNKEVIITKNNTEQKANAVSINEDGELIIRINGRTEIVNSSEVSVRGLLGYN